MPDEEFWTSILNRFPQLPSGVSRGVYVDTMPWDIANELQQRGYTVRYLGAVPRESPDELRAYLLAKSQAVEEGTVTVDKSQLDALKLQMYAAGMLDKRYNPPDKAGADEAEGDATELLFWRRSRHTLRDNSLSLIHI